MLDPPQHLLFAVGKMFLQPMLEQWRNCPWQANNRVTGELRACFCARLQDLRNVMVGEPGNDGRYHYTHWNIRCAKLPDGIKPALRRCRARFEYSLQVWIQRRYRDVDCYCIALREFEKNIYVACDEMVLCDDRHGVSELGALRGSRA